jgi:uncharacterized RDD family membrane protein YckC
VKSNTAQQLAPEAVNPYAAPADTSSAAGQPALASTQLARPSSRLSAHFLDVLTYLLAAVPGGAAGGLLSFALHFPKEPDWVRENAPIFAFGLGALTSLIMYLYQCRLVATSGQSLGKRWKHIRIVLEDGMPPGFWRGVVLRSWVLTLFRFIPVVGNVISLVDALMIFGAGNRCLHDRLAGTRVIKD